MNDKAVNWLVYTFLIGLLPGAARLLVWMLATGEVEPIVTSDVVSYGLVLHSAIVNEVSGSRGKDQKWTTIHSGVSVFFIAIYGLLLFTTIVSADEISEGKTVIASLFLAAFSTLLSVTVFYDRKQAGAKV